MDGDSDGLVPERTCTKCGQKKSISEFYKTTSRHGKEGRRADCVECVKAKGREYVAANKERVSERNAKYRAEHAEELRAYIAEWRLKNPEKQKAASREWYANNKEKAVALSVERIRQNPGKHKLAQASWYQNNKEEADERNRRWKEKNPHKMREYANKHALKRSKDPKHRLEAAVKQGVRRGLIQGSKYGRRTFDLLDFSAEQLRAHLSKKFQPGMTWENYGDWHIDHVIPLSAFNYETPDDIDFKRAWSLSNLQPLWEPDNLSKKDKLFAPFQPSLLLATNDNRKPTPQQETN